MGVRLTGIFGEPVEEAAYDRLKKLLYRLNIGVAKPMQDGLLDTVRSHFSSRFPGSEAYSPDKVYPWDASNGVTPEASIYITAPGVGRAYHDENITPKYRKYLAIPMHREAYGRKPADFTEAFVVKTKNDNLAIAKSTVNGLSFLFSLVKKVFQKKDSRIMPSDRTLANNVFSRIKAHLDDNSAPTGIGGRWY